MTYAENQENHRLKKEDRGRAGKILNSLIFGLNFFAIMFRGTWSLHFPRIKYKDKDETFLEKHLVSKEPFGQFKAWFEEACSRKEILEPNAVFGDCFQRWASIS